MNLYFYLTLSSYWERIAQGLNEIIYIYCIGLSRNITNICGMEEGIKKRKWLVNCRMIGKGMDLTALFFWPSLWRLWEQEELFHNTIDVHGYYWCIWSLVPGSVLVVLTSGRIANRHQAHGWMDSPPCYNQTLCWDCQYEQMLVVTRVLSIRTILRTILLLAKCLVHWHQV